MVIFRSSALQWYWWRSLAALAAAHTPANPPPTISMFDIGRPFRENDGLAVVRFGDRPAQRRECSSDDCGVDLGGRVRHVDVFPDFGDLSVVCFEPEAVFVFIGSASGEFTAHAESDC